MAIQVWGFRNECFERDRVVVGSLQHIESGDWESFHIALVGLDLGSQRGSFYVFLENESRALRVLVKSVLVLTNAAGSVRVDSTLLETKIHAAISKQLAKRK